jgi:hypothetical protein
VHTGQITYKAVAEALGTSRFRPRRLRTLGGSIRSIECSRVAAVDEGDALGLYFADIARGGAHLGVRGGLG